MFNQSYSFKLKNISHNPEKKTIQFFADFLHILDILMREVCYIYDGGQTLAVISIQLKNLIERLKTVGGLGRIVLNYL